MHRRLPQAVATATAKPSTRNNTTSASRSSSMPHLNSRQPPNITPSGSR